MSEQVMNAPSLSRFASPFLRGLVGVVALSAVFTFLWSRSVPGSGFAVSFLILGAFWFLIVTLQSCVEPMLVLKGDGLVVRRWASRLSHIGHGRRYPIQVLNPVEVVVHGRGGRTRIVQLSLFDYSGVPHRIRFYFISLASFEAALAQSGYRHLA